jgi:hypothetical protein
MMTVHFTCTSCGSGVHVFPDQKVNSAECPICQNNFPVFFNADHEKNEVHDCAFCQRKDFYSQRDFNRKLGVMLYLIPTAVCIFWGLIEGILGYFIFWCIDLGLYKWLKSIVICYKCNAIYRNASNAKVVPAFNHEMNDRIIYSDHNFHGKTL